MELVQAFHKIVRGELVPGEVIKISDNCKIVVITTDPLSLKVYIGGKVKLYRQTVRHPAY
jgi:hypothetical protein